MKNILLQQRQERDYLASKKQFEAARGYSY